MRFLDIAFSTSSLAAIALIAMSGRPAAYVFLAMAGLFSRVVCFLFGLLYNRPDLTMFHYGFELCCVALICHAVRVPNGLPVILVIFGIALQLEESRRRHWQTPPPLGALL